MDQIIELEKITKIYEGMNGIPALNGVSVAFRKGEFVSIVGRSGSGKSTLLNMITCIDRPTNGAINFGDEKLHLYNETQLTKWRGQNVGIVFQFFQLMPTLTILENVKLPMDINRIYSKKARMEKAKVLLAKVGIEDCADKLPSEVSGGQQQRAAIARALSCKPKFILADEPTGNLDTATSDNIIHLFRQLVQEGTTIIMVTHNNDIAQLTDRIITICDGQIINDVYNNAVATQ